MNNINNNETFSYTYSANQQQEVKNILKKYVPQEEDKLSQIKRLDRSATSKATTIALIIGVLSTLVLGIGMCCTMVWTDFFVLGIFVGVLGLIGMGFAYPVYKKVLKSQREKIAPQIIKLGEELVHLK